MNENQARALLTTFCSDVTDAMVQQLAEASMGNTEEQSVRALCDHFSTHIRGWFFPHFDFVDDVFVIRFAEMLVRGKTIEQILDAFDEAAHDQGKLTALVGAGQST